MFASRAAWNLTPNQFSAAVERARATEKKLLDLTECNPTRVDLEYDPWVFEPLASLAVLEYRPEAKGMRSAREAVARYYGEQTGTEQDPERVVLTTSTSEAYSFVFRLLCDPGDEVLVPTPSYPLFDILSSLHDVAVRPYPLIYDHAWHIDTHSLANAFTERTKAVMVVHPNNPTGSFVKPQETELLGKFCRARQLALVSDEVFLDYAHDGVARQSFATVNSALTFTLSGLSKISALPQMKLAWIVVSGPEQLAQAAIERLEIIADTYLSVSTPVQLAAPEFLSARSSMQPQLKRRIAANLAEIDRQITEHTSCSRLHIEGGWYAVLRVPATRSDEDLAISLLEQHSVLTHPGHFYDFPTDGQLILSLITREEVFREGILRILGSFQS